MNCNMMYYNTLREIITEIKLQEDGDEDTQ